MAPVLGGVVIERGQMCPVRIELGQRLGILGAVFLAEDLERDAGVLACRGRNDLVQVLLGLGLHALGEAVDDVPRRVKPAALL